LEAYINIFLRIISIMALLVFSTLFIMGKRPIGELPVFDFLSLIVIGAIVGADIADPKIEHLPTAFAVVVLSLFQRLVSLVKLRSKKIRNMLTFEPTIIIKNGKFIYRNIKKINYSLDDILMLLREKDVFDIGIVDFGIIEANGNMSILKKAEFENVTMKDMNLTSSEGSICFSIIVDGYLLKDRITELGFSEQYVIETLKGMGVNSYKELFYASMNNKGELTVSHYNENN
jgi:uncharacterized membrane protein YcaP (DUF421 family)